MQMSGRIITALAALLIIVFAAFVIGQVTVVKLFGLGLALAIVVDAFIIRVTLAPALMRIAGHLNWWAPRGLRRLHLRFGVWESDALDVFDTADREAQEAAARISAAAPSTDGGRRTTPKKPASKRKPAKTTARKPAAPKGAPSARAHRKS
jgi:hypothetical protein